MAPAPHRGRPGRPLASAPQPAGPTAVASDRRRQRGGSDGVHVRSGEPRRSRAWPSAAWSSATSRRPRGGGGSYAHHDPATGRLQAQVPIGGRRRRRRRRRRRPGRPARLAGDPTARSGPPRCCASPSCWRPTAPRRRPSTPGTTAARSASSTRAATPPTGPATTPDGSTRSRAGSSRCRCPATSTTPDPEPYGVVAALVPWNGPMMGMGHKAIPALAAGNTVVAKPPEIAPFGAIRFAELALEAGLPPGAVNVVPGGAATGDAARPPPRASTRSPSPEAWWPPGLGDGGGRRAPHAAVLRARRQVRQHRLPGRRPRPGLHRSPGCSAR